MQFSRCEIQTQTLVNRNQWRNFGLKSGGTKILVGFLDIKKWRGPSPHYKKWGTGPPVPPEITPMIAGHLYAGACPMASIHIWGFGAVSNYHCQLRFTFLLSGIFKHGLRVLIKKNV